MTHGVLKHALFSQIPEFWCPTKLITHDKTFEYDLPKTASPTNYHNSAGLAFEAEHVRQCIKAGLCVLLLLFIK